MKKKMRRFADGGETTDMLPKSALDRLAEGEESGMFDKDVYARARKFMREQAAKGDEAPSAPRAARAAPAAVSRAAAPAASADRAEIPGAGPYRAPAAEGRMMGETERNVRNILSASTPGLVRGAAAVTAPLATAAVRGAQAGRGEAAMAREIGRAAESAPASAARTPMARSAESGMRYTPKQEMEAAESTMRGATSRKGIQAARSARERKSAEAMEEAKPVLQASKKKASPRSRTRDEMEDYELRAKGGKIKGYASGGSVRGGGCEQRGLRKCKVV